MNMWCIALGSHDNWGYILFKSSAHSQIWKVKNQPNIIFVQKCVYGKVYIWETNINGSSMTVCVARATKQRHIHLWVFASVCMHMCVFVSVAVCLLFEFICVCVCFAQAKSMIKVGKFGNKPMFAYLDDSSQKCKQILAQSEKSVNCRKWWLWLVR